MGDSRMRRNTGEAWCDVPRAGKIWKKNFLSARTAAVPGKQAAPAAARRLRLLFSLGRSFIRPDAENTGKRFGIAHFFLPQSTISSIGSSSRFECSMHTPMPQTMQMATAGVSTPSFAQI